MDFTVLYQNEIYEFILKELKSAEQTGAEIIRRRLEDGEETVLFSYYWPVQLTVEVEKGMYPSERMEFCAGSSTSLPIT